MMYHFCLFSLFLSTSFCSSYYQGEITSETSSIENLCENAYNRRSNTLSYQNYLIVELNKILSEKNNSIMMQVEMDLRHADSSEQMRNFVTSEINRLEYKLKAYNESLKLNLLIYKIKNNQSLKVEDKNFIREYGLKDKNEYEEYNTIFFNVDNNIQRIQNIIHKREFNTNSNFFEENRTSSIHSNDILYIGSIDENIVQNTDIDFIVRIFSEDYLYYISKTLSLLQRPDIQSIILTLLVIFIYVIIILIMAKM